MPKGVCFFNKRNEGAGGGEVDRGGGDAGQFLQVAAEPRSATALRLRAPPGLRAPTGDRDGDGDGPW